MTGARPICVRKTISLSSRDSESWVLEKPNKRVCVFVPGATSPIPACTAGLPCASTAVIDVTSSIDPGKRRNTAQPYNILIIESAGKRGLQCFQNRRRAFPAHDRIETRDRARVNLRAVARQVPRSAQTRNLSPRRPPFDIPSAPTLISLAHGEFVIEAVDFLGGPLRWVLRNPEIALMGMQASGAEHSKSYRKFAPGHPTLTWVPATAFHHCFKPELYLRPFGRDYAEVDRYRAGFHPD